MDICCVLAAAPAGGFQMGKWISGREGGERNAAARKRCAYEMLWVERNCICRSWNVPSEVEVVLGFM